MKQKKLIGVCMDHSSAYLIEPAGKEFITNVIKSDFDHHDKHSISKNENLMHNKEQGHSHTYYKSITEVISHYDEIVLFGQTEAKKELMNLLRTNRDFEFKKVETIDTDKMTENQQKGIRKRILSNKLKSN
jgi:hypothetical protein